MKILLITEYWEPEIGGVQRYLKGLVDALIARGDRVTVIAPRLKEKNGDDGQYVIRRRFHWPVMKPSWWLLYRWMISEVKKGDYDVIFCGKGLFEGRLAKRIGQKTDTPYVVFTYGKEINEWLGASKTKRQLKKVLKNAKYVIGINDVVKNKLKEEAGMEDGKFIKLTPGLNDFWGEPVPEKEISEVLKKCQIAKPYVLSVGRLEKRKGFTDLIEAFGGLDQVKFEDYKLIIVGDGAEEEQLQRLIEREWLTNRVILLDDVNDEELRAFYAGANLFALTPKDIEGDIEGFGIVYLEAAAQGVPAVGTDSGGVKEAVINGETGILVQEEDIGAIKEAMEKLLEDRDLRNRLGGQAKAATKNQGWKDKIETLSSRLSAQS